MSRPHLAATVLHRLLRGLIRAGRLRLVLPDATVLTIAGGPGPEIGLRIADWPTVRRLVLDPALAFGEAFADGRLVPAGGDIGEVLAFIYANLETGGQHPLATLRARAARLTRGLAQYNPRPRARRNAAHHYDLDRHFYALFLDADLQYSCAYFPRGDETLEEAQAAKKALLARKLLLRPGMSVLDIGAGWGGLALTLAREHGVRVTGITLSGEQLDTSRARARAEGLDGRVRFELADYRSVSGRYDRIVSVGMFEHVGLPHYGEFFRAVAARLAPGGVALLHAIGRSRGPAATNPWVAKHIFPGGYAPALSEVWGPLERSGLVATDLEILRLHYARTLHLWRARFARSRDAVERLYDARFARIFDLYLAGAEASFRHLGLMVWQIQLAHRQDAVPLTRDYLLSPPPAAAGGELFQMGHGRR